jgi:hypothetical protein
MPSLKAALGNLQEADHKRNKGSDVVQRNFPDAAARAVED